MAVHIPHVPATFIHVPKTAGSAFSEWLELHVPNIENKSKHCLRSEAQTIWPNLGTTFSFVRNPWDRAVSYWSFIGQRAEERVANRLANLPVKKTTHQALDLQIVDLYRKGFSHWVQLLYDKIPNAYDIRIDAHHRRDTPQTHWTRDVDRIFKVENFDTQFSQIQDLVGCYEPIEKKNLTVRTHYRDYYDEHTRDLVAEIFEADIKEFDYVF